MKREKVNRSITILFVISCVALGVVSFSCRGTDNKLLAKSTETENVSAEFVISGDEEDGNISIRIPNPAEWKPLFRDIRKAGPIEMRAKAALLFKNGKNTTEISLLEGFLYRRAGSCSFYSSPSLVEKIYSLVVPLLDKIEPHEIKSFTLGCFIMDYFTDTEKVEKGIELLKAFANAKEPYYSEREDAKFFIEDYKEEKDREKKILGTSIIYPFDVSCKKPSNIVLNAKFPDVSQEMVVYVEDWSYKGKEWVKKFIKKHFGVKEAIIELKEDPYEETPFEVGCKDFGLSISGDCQELIYEPHFDDVSEGSKLPDVKETVLRFLKKHKLLLQNSYIKEVDFYDFDDDGNTDAVNVTFLMKDIDGIKIQGRGVTTTFDIRGDKIVINIMPWPEIKPFKTWPIKSCQEAFDAWKKGNGIIYDDEAGEVNKITLVYYWDSFEGIIQPCYRFDCISNDGQRKFYGFIPAIKDEFLFKE